ncbi:MAG TPA: HAD family hydrolase [Chitinophagaceae bacterium]|nr:HAD family hydrolase [Chitinophagaceae bacterium]
MQAGTITTLFLDIGGVLLTNGWGRSSRKLAAEHFKLDVVELNERHHLTFDTYEIGKISLDEYLERIVFYEKRDFTVEDFKTFMYGQTQPYTDSIEFFKKLKQRHGLKVIAVNNEGRELNDYRINQFRLYELFDAYASSCYVKFRKPDIDIFRIACDIGKVAPQQTVMVDDRQMFTQVASTIGINCLHFDSLEGIKEKMKTLNLQNS